MDDRDLFQTARFPTPSHPLLGLTILVVEDSRYACDALRLMCLRSGARIRRADSLGAAQKHLLIYRPSVILIDLGLPDGDGRQLIRLLHTARPRIEVILGTSGDDAARDAVMASGADGFLSKPLSSLASFQELILSCLPEDRRPMGPRMVNQGQIEPDAAAYHEDLAHAANLLGKDPSDGVLDYLAQFLTGIARCAGDRALLSAGEALAIARMQHRNCQRNITQITALIDQRRAQVRGLKRGI